MLCFVVLWTCDLRTCCLKNKCIKSAVVLCYENVWDLLECTKSMMHALRVVTVHAPLHGFWIAPCSSRYSGCAALPQRACKAHQYALPKEGKQALLKRAAVRFWCNIMAFQSAWHAHHACSWRTALLRCLGQSSKKATPWMCLGRSWRWAAHLMSCLDMWWGNACFLLFACCHGCAGLLGKCLFFAFCMLPWLCLSLDRSWRRAVLAFLHKILHLRPISVAGVSPKPYQGFPRQGWMHSIRAAVCAPQKPCSLRLTSYWTRKGEHMSFLLEPEHWSRHVLTCAHCTTTLGWP